MKITLDFDKWTLDEAIAFEDAAGKPYWEAVAEIGARAMSTRTAAALAFIAARRVAPGLTWEEHVAQGATAFISELEIDATPLDKAPETPEPAES